MGFAITSCNDEETSVIKDEPYIVNTSQQSNLAKDQIASRVALNLAKSLGNQSIREFIKKKSIEQFDGDYNFLVEFSKAEQITVSKNGRSSSLNFASILSGQNQGSSARTAENSFLDSLSTIYPLLQVAIPALENENVEMWEIESEIPLVAFIPQNYKATDIIPAYDLDGNYYELSSTEEPNRLTIVISENERLMVFEKESASANGRSQLVCPIIDECSITQEAYYENDQNLYYLRSDVFEEINQCTGGGGSGGGSGGGTGGGSGTITCDRDRKSGKEKLHRMIFNSMSDFRDTNKWFDGGQDLEVTIFFAQANGSISKVTKGFSGKHGDFKKCPLFKSCRTKWFGLGDTEIVS